MQPYNYRSVKALSEHRYSQIDKNDQNHKRHRPNKIWGDEIWPVQIGPDQIGPVQMSVKSEQPVSVRTPDRWRAA